MKKKSLTIGVLVWLVACLACDPPCELPSANAQKYVVVHTYGGLGNRLMALASGASVAKQTGRKLAVWWDVSPEELPARFDELFQTPITLLEDVSLPSGWNALDILDPSVVCKPVVKRWGYLYDQFSALPSFFNDTAQFLVVHSVRPFGTTDAQLSLTEYIKYMKELEPIDSIKEAVANFQKQIFIEKRPVGVHYRSWVLTADARPIVKDASKKIYLEKMKEALTKDPNTIFYIASDNLDVTNFFQTQFQADQIARYPLDSVERATVEDTQNSLIDWLLLGSADYMIGTYDSTFSESAAVRTNEERLIAIGPVLPGDTLGELFCYNRDGFIDRNNLNPAIICPAYYAN